MRVRLGKFARTGIETLFGADLAAGVQAALAHYSSRLRCAPGPIGLPPWWCAPETAGGTDLEVTVESDLEQRFEHESRRQAATVERLVTHAILVYLADVDRATSDDADAEPLTPASW